MDILQIKASINGENSQSNKLSNEIVSKIQLVHAGSKVTTVDLGRNPLPYINIDQVAASFVPKDRRSEEQKALLKYADNAIAQVKAAAIIVIGVPLYNFSIPATLKSWIDQISRANETFSYATGVPQGLIQHKKVYLAVASGGVYAEGFMKDFDFAVPYLRYALGFLGMTDITVFRVEGLVLPEIKDAAFEKAIATLNEYVF